MCSHLPADAHLPFEQIAPNSFSTLDNPPTWWIDIFFVSTSDTRRLQKWSRHFIDRIFTYLWMSFDKNYNKVLTDVLQMTKGFSVWRHREILFPHVAFDVVHRDDRILDAILVEWYLFEVGIGQRRNSWRTVHSVHWRKLRLVHHCQRCSSRQCPVVSLLSLMKS